MRGGGAKSVYTFRTDRRELPTTTVSIRSRYRRDGSRRRDQPVANSVPDTRPFHSRRPDPQRRKQLVCDFERRFTALGSELESLAPQTVDTSRSSRAGTGFESRAAVLRLCRLISTADRTHSENRIETVDVQGHRVARQRWSASAVSRHRHLELHDPFSQYSANRQQEKETMSRGSLNQVQNVH